MKEKLKKVSAVVTGVGVTLATGMTAFASEGSGIVSGAIETATASVKTEAAVVIGSAVGLGVVFWGAKLLWGKFKSMAK